MMNFMASVTVTGRYPVTDVRAVGAMITCCYGNTHELPSNSSRPDQLVEHAASFA